MTNGTSWTTPSEPRGTVLVLNPQFNIFLHTLYVLGDDVHLKTCVLYDLIISCSELASQQTSGKCPNML